MTSVYSPNRLSLKRRILSAGSWSLAGYAFSYPIRLGSSLVLTRLLVPQMFGVMAIATMVMTGLQMFSDLGLHKISSKVSAVAMQPISTPRGQSRSFVDYCFGPWRFAPPLFVYVANQFDLVPKTSVYADPYLPFVIAAVSVSAILGGFRSTKASEASRHMSLRYVTQIQFASQIAGLICMIGWILVDRSIWGLVAGSICSSAVTTLLSHAWLPGTANRWHWDRSAFHEILHFGKWMFLSSILGFLANNADRMLLGGYVDAATLGIYSIAFTFSSAIAQILNKLISDVSYSALSEVARERSSELKRSLYRFHILTASFAYFCAGALIVSGNTLIRLLYDPRYEQAGWMLEVLAVGLLSVPFNLAVYSMLARGLPKIFTYLIAIRVAVTVTLIPLGFHLFGVPGVLWAIVASQLSMMPPTIYYQVKYDLFDLTRELLLLPALLAGMIAGEGFNLALAIH